MLRVPNFSDELSLLYCLLLNAAVFGSAWAFACRRLTSSRSQAVLDAALIGYAIQYLAVGVPGVFGCLSFGRVVVVAVICIVGLLVAAGRSKQVMLPVVPLRDRFFVGGATLFAFTFILIFARGQAVLPPIANDAMTYHFPSAVQWLQQGRIGLFQTWFFNPSNTYSPLAGSMFILWLILPFGSDVVARFVEVPALFCVGLATYRLCCEIGVRRSVAALITVAAVLCRPIFLPCMMAKDDLFVVFFFVTALVGLSRNRAEERWGGIRIGLALGLLLSTKYTAFLSLPILLFAIQGPRGPAKRWAGVLGIVILLAGPWYLRNWIIAANPLFPVGSLFTAGRSDSFHTFAGMYSTVIGGEYGLPMSTAIIMAIALAIACVYSRTMLILRACSIGSIGGIAIFFWRSPFPEVRFLMPVFPLLFACVAFSIERLCRTERLAIGVAAGLAILSLATLFAGLFSAVAVPFALVSLMVAVIFAGIIEWAGRRRSRKILTVGLATAVFFVFTYINWAAFCIYQRRTRFLDGAGYSVEYPDSTRMWNFVDQNIPADATVAYTNLHFVYPLQGGLLQRRLIYAPTRRGVTTVADLGWLGKHLSGEKLVPAAIRATVAMPNREVWLTNLRKSNAKYLVVGRSDLIDVPPEVDLAAGDPGKFSLLYKGPSGWVYRLNDRELR